MAQQGQRQQGRQPEDDPHAGWEEESMDVDAELGQRPVQAERQTVDTQLAARMQAQALLEAAGVQLPGIGSALPHRDLRSAGTSAQHAAARQSAQAAEHVVPGIAQPGTAETGAVSADLISAIKQIVREQMAEERSSQPSTSTVPGAAENPPPMRITPKDVTLDTFSGNDDPDAADIDPAMFYACIEWGESAEFTIKSSGLQPQLQASVLISHLRGAARRLFRQKYANVDLSTWSLAEAKLAVAGLVPQSKVLFSRKAYDMKFNKASLSSDIARFANYLAHGELPVDGYEYYHALLLEKLALADPTCLSEGSSRYGLSIVFKPSFTDIIADAQALVRAVTVGRGSGAAARAAVIPIPVGAGSEKGKKRQRGSSATPVPRDAETEKSDSRFLRAYDRCLRCGWHLRGASVHQHQAAGVCDPKRLHARIARMREDLARGGDPNAAASHQGSAQAQQGGSASGAVAPSGGRGNRGRGRRGRNGRGGGRVHWSDGGRSDGGSQTPPAA